ncbi:MAG TPA: ParM/StbA family protein [Symbiobacteriaceae bacterium]|jgi:hypothetical protein
MGDIPLFGVDLGFGLVKVAGPGYRESFPAVVAELGAWSDPAGLVEFDGHAYLIGEPALSLEHRRWAIRDDKIVTVDEKAKCLVALAHLARHYNTTVMALATGLPPAHYNSPGRQAEMKQHMTDVFDFRYNGLPYHVEVAGVSVDPQSGAAFFDFLLHDDGELNTANADLLELRSIVIDPGHRTTDVCLMNGRKAALGNRSIMTIDQGVWTVYEETKRLIQTEYGVTKEPEEIDALWRRRESFRVSGRSVPLGELIARAAAPIARSIAAKAMRHAGDVRLWDVALLVGGGSHLFEGVLAAELGVPVRMPRRPEFGNVGGYFKRKLERR